MKSKSFKSIYSRISLFCLFISLQLLAACGDAPAPTKVATTTSSASTPSATTANNSVKAGGLEVAGASEVQLDSAFSSEVAKLLPGAKNLIAKLYVSADNAEKLAGNFDITITTKGYIGLAGKPTKSGNSYVGIYSKAGADDLIITILDVPKDNSQLSENLNFQGLSDSTVSKLYKQIEGKKGVALVFSGRDLIKAVFEATNADANITPRVEVTAPPSTTTPGSTGIMTGQGSELLNKLVATREVDLKIKKIERFDEFKYEDKVIKTKGVYLVITYDFVNLSKTPVAHTPLTLRDSQNREFENMVEYEAVGVLNNLGYKPSYIINPGFVGSDYKVYDIPKDASGLQLIPFFETDRKPSAASLNNSGGKGADSSAGAELAGKNLTVTDDKTDIKVISVERYNTLKDGSKTYKSDGMYLIVTYEMKNNASKPVTAPLFYLQDREGRIYSSSDNFDINFAVAKNSKTKYDDVVNPGLIGVNYKVFEVLKEASGFNLAELN